MSIIDGILLFCCALMWGSVFILIKIALEYLPLFTLVSLRLVLAALFLWVYILLKGGTLPKQGRVWVSFFILGLLNCVVPYLLITWGEVYIDSGLAAILNATMPLFTIVLAHLFTQNEKFTLRKTLGTIIGLAGVMILIGPEALKGLGVHLWAQLAMILASISYAGAAVYGTLVKGFDSPVLAFGQISTAALFMLPFCILDQPSMIQISLPAVFAILGLSILGTALPYLIYFYLIKSIGATKTSLFSYLIPVVGVVLGVLMLEETATWTQLLALLVILAGVFATSELKTRIPVREK